MIISLISIDEQITLLRHTFMVLLKSRHSLWSVLFGKMNDYIYNEIHSGNNTDYNTTIQTTIVIKNNCSLECP